MFEKFTKILKGAALIISVMSANSSELEVLNSYKQTAKVMATSFIDSFETGKPNRSFVAMMHYEGLRTGLAHICTIGILQEAARNFFTALSQIFSGETVEVSDHSLDLILQSAIAGYRDADDIIKAVSDGKSISAITMEDYSDLKKKIKMRLQNLIEMRETKLDSTTISDIQKVVSSKNMRKVATRQASNNASIHVLTEYVTQLCDSETPNSKIFGKLKFKICRLLEDEAPNKKWILSLISELNSKEKTKAFYEELVTLIQQ